MVGRPVPWRSCEPKGSPMFGGLVYWHNRRRSGAPVPVSGIHPVGLRWRSLGWPGRWLASPKMAQLEGALHVECRRHNSKFQSQLVRSSAWKCRPTPGMTGQTPALSRSPIEIKALHIGESVAGRCTSIGGLCGRCTVTCPTAFLQWGATNSTSGATPRSRRT